MLAVYFSLVRLTSGATAIVYGGSALGEGQNGIGEELRHIQPFGLLRLSLSLSANFQLLWLLPLSDSPLPLFA